LEVNGFNIGAVQNATGAEIIPPNSVLKVTDPSRGYPQTCEEIILTSYTGTFDSVKRSFISVDGEAKEISSVSQNIGGNFSDAAQTSARVNDKIVTSPDGSMVWHILDDGNNDTDLYQYTASGRQQYAGTENPTAVNDRYVARVDSDDLYLSDYVAGEIGLIRYAEKHGKNSSASAEFDSTPWDAGNYNPQLALSPGVEPYVAYRSRENSYGWELIIPGRQGDFSHTSFVFPETVNDNIEAGAFCCKPEGSVIYFGGKNNAVLTIYKAINVAQTDSLTPAIERVIVIDQTATPEEYQGLAENDFKFGTPVPLSPNRLLVPLSDESSGRVRYYSYDITLNVWRLIADLGEVTIANTRSRLMSACQVNVASKTESQINANEPDLLASTRVRMVGIKVEQ